MSMFTADNGRIYGIERDVDALKCECGGYAERVDATPEEGIELGCGREKFSITHFPGQRFRECCVRAFECVICKKRIVGQASAPEMD